jgi:hypothetical protein
MLEEFFHDETSLAAKCALDNHALAGASLQRGSDPPDAAARWLRSRWRSGQLYIDDVLDHWAIKWPIEFHPGPLAPDPANLARQAFDRLETDNNRLPWPQQAFRSRHAATLG